MLEVWRAGLGLGLEVGFGSRSRIGVELVGYPCPPVPIRPDSTTHPTPTLISIHAHSHSHSLTPPSTPTRTRTRTHQLRDSSRFLGRCLGCSIIIYNKRTHISRCLLSDVVPDLVIRRTTIGGVRGGTNTSRGVAYVRLGCSGVGGVDVGTGAGPGRLMVRCWGWGWCQGWRSAKAGAGAPTFG